MWLVPFEDLSADQAAAVALDTSKHRIIRGGPGSGKTLVLAHRAKALIEQRGIPRERLRVLVYTRVLNAYIRQGLADLGLADVCQGYDEWCRSVLSARRIPTPKGSPGSVTELLRTLVLEALSQDAEPMLDAILVDEGQDLTETMLRILPRAARHVTVAMDSAQQLYEEGSDLGRVAAALSLPARPAALLTAYRCTPHIVGLASVFLDDPGERHRFRYANLMPLGASEQPVLVTSPDEEAELDTLAAALQERAFVGQRSVVLLPTNRDLFRFKKRLRERGMDVYHRKELGFDGNRPLLLTYHSAKGLTAEAVFLPKLTVGGFDSRPDDMVARMLFVGVTRATEWAWLGTRASDRLPLLARLGAPLREGHLVDLSTSAPQTVEPDGGGRPKPPTEPTDDSAGDDELMDLFD